jgi:WD40 repeat protein
LKYKPDKGKVVQAHNGPIAQIALNKTGTVLATMSDKGTLIRLWDTKSAKKLHELRRGTYQATINEISFERSTSKYLCVSSDHDTLHIFNVEAGTKNTGSWFSALGMVGVPVVSSEWSHC